jgi:TatD DNase family protein
MMCCATHPGDWDSVCRIAKRHTGTVMISLGVHPYRASEVSTAELEAGKEPEWLSQLRARLQPASCGTSSAVAEVKSTHRLVGGVGECGLDFSASGLRRCERTKQLQVYEAQVRLAKELAAPLTIHCVRAFKDVLRVIRSHSPMPAPVVFHSFGEHAEAITQIFGSPKAGFRPSSIGQVYLSFSGSVCNPLFRKARASAAACPAEAVLLETDSPDQLHGMQALDLRASDIVGSEEEAPGSAVAGEGAHCCSSAADPGSAALNRPGNIVTVAVTVAALRDCPVPRLLGEAATNFERAYQALSGKPLSL